MMAARVTNILLMVFFLTACNDGLVNNSPKEDFPLLLKLQIDEGKYGRWQDVDVTYSITNISDKTVSFGFPSSCQVGYTVERNGHLIFDSRKNFVCAAVITGFKLKPGESKTFPIKLIYLDGVTIPSGTYRIGAFLLKNQSSVVYSTFRVREE